jgi:hypothetical protein
MKKIESFIKNRKFFWSCILALLFVAQFLIINPIGNFALNDSWVHADTIKHLLETGEFRMIPWAGPTFYIPILYGFFVAKLFGFSFTLFRITTLVLSFLLLLVLYIFLLEVSKQPILSFLFSLVLWLSPIFYNLSFTFMTSIPALFCLLLSMFFYYKGFTQNEDKFLLLGSLISLAGFFIRQTNILLWFAGITYYLWCFFQNFNDDERNKYSIMFKKLIKLFIIPLLLFTGVYLSLYFFNLLPQNLAKAHLKQINLSFLVHFFHWSWFYLSYSALFLSPILCGILVTQKNFFHSIKYWLLTSFSLFFSLIFNFSWSSRYEKIGNIINQFGLGPYRVIQGNLEIFLTEDFFLLLDLLAGICFGSLLYLIWVKFDKIEHDLNFIIIFFLTYLGVVSSVVAFDRYILPITLSVLIILASVIKQFNVNYKVTFCCILIIGIFSISQTQHYIEWNRVRTKFANSVLDNKVPATKIDAGVEWNGVHDYWNVAHTKIKPTESKPWWIQDMFSANTEEYVVSFSKFDKYNILKQKQLDSWFNPNNEIYLLEKSKK